MPRLRDDRQDRFCHEYLVHERVGAPAARAAGFSTKNSAAQACTLLKRPEIQERISELAIQANTAREAERELTPEEHMLKLANLRDESKRLGPLGPAVRNEELRGRVAGYYVERHEIAAVDQLSDRELSAKAAAFLGFTAELVAQTMDPSGLFDD